MQKDFGMPVFRMVVWLMRLSLTNDQKEVTRYQRVNNTATQSNIQVPVPEVKPSKPTNPNSSSSLNTNTFTSKPSFVSVIQPKTNPVVGKPSTVTVQTITLKEQDLINIEDSSTVPLVKLKHVDTMGNIYTICKNAGFLDFSIDHVGGLWIWIQFPLSKACSNYQENVGMKTIFIIAKPPSPSFKVDERMIWTEISGLPLCAWVSNDFKRVASVFGKLMFFEAEESTAMSEGTMCIATRSQKLIYEKIHIEVLEESFEVQVQELGTWSINICDNSLDTSSHIDINDVVKVADSVEDNSIDDLNDLNAKINKRDQDFNDDEGLMINLTNTLLKVLKEEEVNREQVSNHDVETSDPNGPPGFEHINR
nr:RNA-directed DNA polymerase, eukaryota [Tanacetum cinerariifolium]